VKHPRSRGSKKEKPDASSWVDKEVNRVVEGKKDIKYHMPLFIPINKEEMGLSKSRKKK